MKILKNISLGLVALAAFALASCSNDLPKFNDADAFVAFTSTSAVSVNEDAETLEIPVLLTSLGGKEGTVDFEFVPDATSPAVEGTNFTVANASKTLTFTSDANTQKIKLNIINLKDKFTGDLRFTVKLTNPQGVNLGADNTLTVTIADLDHPLAFMLGTYSATAVTNWDEDTQWNVKISKDDSDVSKVWITNLVPDGSSASSPVYGTVNDAKTEIHIPVGQETAVSSSYPHICLEGFYGEDGDEAVDDYLVGTITTDANGNAIITFADYWFGALAYSDDSKSTAAGWFNLIKAGTVMTLSK